MAATAQLIMYSGSLNPSKALTKDESSAISTAVKRALSEGPVLAEPPPQLGGIIVEWDAEDPSFPQAVIARNGVVTIYGRNANPESRADVAGVESQVRMALKDVIAAGASH